MGDRVPPFVLHSPLRGRDLHRAVEQLPCPCRPLRGHSQGVLAVLLGCLLSPLGLPQGPACGAEGTAQSRAQLRLERGLGLHHPRGMEEGAGVAQRDRDMSPPSAHPAWTPLMRGSSWGSHPTLGSRSPGPLCSRWALAWNQTRPLAFLGPRQDAAGFFCFKRKPKKKRKRKKTPRNRKSCFFGVTLGCCSCRACTSVPSLHPPLWQGMCVGPWGLETTG